MDKSKDKTPISSLGKRTIDYHQKLFSRQKFDDRSRASPKFQLISLSNDTQYIKNSQVSKANPSIYDNHRRSGSYDQKNKSNQISSQFTNTRKSINNILHEQNSLYNRLKSSRDLLKKLSDELNFQNTKTHHLRNKLQQSKRSNIFKLGFQYQSPRTFEQKQGQIPLNLPKIHRLTMKSPTEYKSHSKSQYYQISIAKKLPSRRQSNKSIINYSSVKTQFQNNGKHSVFSKLDIEQKKQGCKYATKSIEDHRVKSNISERVSVNTIDLQKKQKVRKRLRKCFLSVFWICCQRKQTQKKKSKRRNKHKSHFNNIKQNAFNHLSLESLCFFRPLVQYIKLFTNKMASEQNSKYYLIHLSEVQKCTLGIIKKLRKVMLRDKNTYKVLKIFIRQRQEVPDNYLTFFELQRIQVSQMFGSIVKSFATCTILLITFLFVRVLLIRILDYALNLNTSLKNNPVWSKTLNDLRACIYEQCLQIIQEQIQESECNDYLGNWKDVKQQIKYMKAKSLRSGQSEIVEQCLVSNNWKTDAARMLKSQLPNNWQLFKDDIRQWCYQLYEELRQPTNVFEKKSTILKDQQ